MVSSIELTPETFIENPIMARGRLLLFTLPRDCPVSRICSLLLCDSQIGQNREINCYFRKTLKYCLIVERIFVARNVSLAVVTMRKDKERNGGDLGEVGG